MSDNLTHGSSERKDKYDDERSVRQIAGTLHMLYSLAIDYEREHGSPEQADRMVDALACVPEIPSW